MLHQWKIGFLTADEKEKSSRSPPVVARSDGTMLLWPPVVVLSSWRMKSGSILWDIYLNKVLCPVFDKRVNMQTSHSLVRKHDSDFKQVISQNWWGLTAMPWALNSSQLGSGTGTLFCNCHLSYDKKSKGKKAWVILWRHTVTITCLYKSLTSESCWEKHAIQFWVNTFFVKHDQMLIENFKDMGNNFCHDK